MQAGRVIGRAKECAAINDFLGLEVPGALGRGVPALVLAGEAGLGKTVLWREGRERAARAGFRTLVARPLESEMVLGFSGLADLMAHVEEDVIDGLPAPQQHALRVALLREAGSEEPPDRRSLGTAVRNLLCSLARQRPVLLAVDDIGWLDSASEAVLGFALRRIDDADVRVLATLRAEPGEAVTGLLSGALAEDHLRVVVPEPLSRVELSELLGGVASRGPRRRLVEQVYAASGGNPYLAVELGRALIGQAPAPGSEPLRVPRSLQPLLRAQVAGLPAAVRRVLLAAALARDPSTGLLSEVLGEEVAARLEVAESAGIVDLREGRVRFGHPLLRSAVIDDAGPVERRAAHAALSSASGTDIERALHRARACIGPDLAVAGDLDAAADLARSHGMSELAAEVAGLAVAMTPAAAATERLARRLAAADHHFAAGDAAWALSEAREVVDALPRGMDRARGMERVAVYERYCGAPLAQWSATLHRALTEAGDDPDLRLRAHYGLGIAALNGGDPAAAPRHLRAVAALADATGDRAAAARGATAELWVELCLGQGLRPELVARALSAPERTRWLEVEERPSYTVALASALTGELRAARDLLTGDLRDAAARGDEVALPLLAWLAVLVDTWSGEWGPATRVAAEGYAAAELSGSDVARAFMAAACSHLWGSRGDLARARHECELAISLGERTGLSLPRALGSWGGAVAALAAADPVEAYRLLEGPVEVAARQRFPEPALALFVPDAAEALVRLGRLADARALLDAFEPRCSALGRGRSLAEVARARALLAVAERDLTGATQHADRAVLLCSGLDLPLEHARALLVAAEVDRRARQRRRAREHLVRARSILVGLDARAWLARCEAALASHPDSDPTSGRHDVGPLTPTERQVADLAGEGRTTREIAAIVFASTRTVETHLQRVYRKLGVRSRAELIRWAASRRQPEPQDSADPTD